MARVPVEADAFAIGADLAGQPVLRAVRFPTGGQHFVYDLTLVDGTNAVLRLTRPHEGTLARAALGWNQRLRPLGIPLPRVLAEDVGGGRRGIPALLLERLPGTDLGNEIVHLSRPALQRIAERLIALQHIVSRLPEGRGYGFVLDPEGPFPQSTWRGLIAAHLARSRARIAAAKVVSTSVPERVERAADALGAAFDRIPSSPFLHDITTKNVIIADGELTGIVDVDELCYGDPLLLVGLIRTALEAHAMPPDYAEIWLDGLGADRSARAREAFYAALFAADFLGEIGHRFNRAAAAPLEPAQVSRLERLAADNLARSAALSR